jgi:poly(A) polymerase
VEEGHPFEVATFRKEKEYLDGRRPTYIEKASPEEDAQRRDFTINGMFFDPITEEIYDFIGGKEDLEKGIIRAIGDPHHRFLEDRLRMIRAVRYSTRFHFPIDIDTEQAILSHASSLFPSVAIERVWQEFEKLSSFASLSKGLAILYRLQLLSTIFPALKDFPSIEVENRLSLFASFPTNTPLIIQLAHLFPEDSLSSHLELCDYLKLSRKEKKHIEFLHHAKKLLTLPLAWQENISDFELAHFYAHPLSEILLTFYKAPTLHAHKQELLYPYIQRIKEKKPLITASDLLPLIPPSPTLGLLLQEAEKLSINLKLSSKQEILLALTKSSLWPK